MVYHPLKIWYLIKKKLSITFAKKAMTISPPQQSEYPSFYETYVCKVCENESLIPALGEDLRATIELVSSLSKDMLSHRYQPGKWAMSEILCHVIDAERISAYRALRFARNNQTPLPGFDQEKYVSYMNADNRGIESILKEFEVVRSSTKMLFEGFEEDALTRTGSASSNEFTVRAKGYIILGHSHHHMQIFRERYLGQA